MAADGYGAGKVVGNDGQQDLVVRTADSQISFLFDKQPNPESLAAAAWQQFRRVSRQRRMKQ
jgi:hypothetical protein